MASAPVCAIRICFQAPFGSGLTDAFEAVVFVLFSCRVRIGFLDMTIIEWIPGLSK